MKIVHIATYINGGAGTAAYRIHEALLKQNIHSTFLCTDVPLLPATKAVVRFQKPTYNLWQRAIRKAKRLLAKYNTPGKINYRYRLQQQLNTMQPLLNCEVAGLPFSEYNLLEHPAVKNADIIHLHWVAGFIDYPSFFKKINRPIVWTFHDMNPIKGLYHYNNDEQLNEATGGLLNKEVYAIKQNAVDNFKNGLTVVCPSQWLKTETENSLLFKKRSILKIPYTLDINVFNLKNKNIVRKELDIPEGHTVFLFVTQSVSNYRKGFDLLMEALAEIDPANKTLLIIGEKITTLDVDFNCIYPGFIKDESLLSKYYSAADAFILPSREDNLPNVMLESLSCGTPILCFNVGGMAEVIQDKFNGLKASEVNGGALKNTMEAFIINKGKFNQKAIRQFAIDKFSNKVIASEYLDIYKETCQQVLDY